MAEKFLIFFIAMLLANLIAGAILEVIRFFFVSGPEVSTRRTTRLRPNQTTGVYSRSDEVLWEEEQERIKNKTKSIS